MFEPDAVRKDRKGLAESLRTLRRDSGLSGERLANRTHMSQAKISRIETGRLLPSITDVERILKALAVPADEAADLLALAKIANTEFLSRRKTRRYGLPNRQREIVALMEQSSQIRFVLPTALSGLLQTPEYVRASSAPINIFTIYDERLLIVETEAGEMALRDPVDVREHLELDECYRRNALKGEECREFLRAIAADFRSRAG